VRTQFLPKQQKFQCRGDPLWINTRESRNGLMLRVLILPHFLSNQFIARTENSRPMWQQGRSTLFGELDIDALRVRLQKMNDEQLVRFGKAAGFMGSPGANFG
jgi:hypothetical protein